jgi:transcriptional regulator with XRE-family HTH domain
MTKTPIRTDVVVGARVRARRKELGITQTTLGDRLGVTFQQVQKYERGTNRIGAGRLHAIAQALAVPVSYFFPGSNSRGPSDEIVDLLTTPGAIELLRDFACITDNAVRKSLGNLAKTFADAGIGAAINPIGRRSKGSASESAARK